MIPRLIHPITVFLRKADKKFTAVMDDRLNEPVGQVRRQDKPKKLVAQIHRGKVTTTSSEGGVTLEADGYLLFRTLDLRRENYEVEMGDLITQIGEEPNEEEVDFYVVKLQPLGHYPRARGNTMVRAYFQDRQPSRRARGSY